MMPTPNTPHGNKVKSNNNIFGVMSAKYSRLILIHLNHFLGLARASTKSMTCSSATTDFAFSFTVKRMWLILRKLLKIERTERLVFEMGNDAHKTNRRTYKVIAALRAE